MFLEFFLFIFGLIIGSFLNVVIYRSIKNQSLFFSRSYCPKCKQVLKTVDLIPILSYIFLKGKCRYCFQKISLYYPLVELTTGISFVLIYKLHFSLDNSINIFNFQSFLTFFYLLIITCFFIIIFYSDLKYYLIPDKIIYSAILICFLYTSISLFFFNNKNLLFFDNLKGLILIPLFTGFICSILFFSIYFFSKAKAIGFGDVKLVFLIGYFLSYPKILSGLFLAFLIGGTVGIFLILLGKKKLKSQVPFAPFLILGTFSAFFLEKETIFLLNFLNIAS